MRSCLFVGFTKKSVTNSTNELRICGLLSYLTVCETGKSAIFACRFTEKPQGALYRRRGIGETFRSFRVNAAYAAPQSFGSSYAQLAGFGKTAEAAEPARKSCFFKEKLNTGQELRRIFEPKHYSVAESIHRAGHGDALNGDCLQKGSADTAERGVESCKYGYAAACGGGYEAQQPFIRAECEQTIPLYPPLWRQFSMTDRLSRQQSDGMPIFMNLRAITLPRAAVLSQIRSFVAIFSPIYSGLPFFGSPMWFILSFVKVRLYCR